MYLDSKLHFKELVKSKLNELSKVIGLLPKLRKMLPRPPLITVYESLIRSHLDYGDIICDRAHNFLFHQKIDYIQ